MSDYQLLRKKHINYMPGKRRIKIISKPANIMLAYNILLAFCLDLRCYFTIAGGPKKVYNVIYRKSV